MYVWEYTPHGLWCWSTTILSWASLQGYSPILMTRLCRSAIKKLINLVKTLHACMYTIASWSYKQQLCIRVWQVWEGTWPRNNSNKMKHEIGSLRGEIRQPQNALQAHTISLCHLLIISTDYSVRVEQRAATVLVYSRLYTGPGLPSHPVSKATAPYYCHGPKMWLTYVGICM